MMIGGCEHYTLQFETQPHIPKCSSAKLVLAGHGERRERKKIVILYVCTMVRLCVSLCHGISYVYYDFVDIVNCFTLSTIQHSDDGNSYMSNSSENRSGVHYVQFRYFTNANTKCSMESLDGKRERERARARLFISYFHVCILLVRQSEMNEVRISYIMVQYSRTSPQKFSFPECVCVCVTVDNLSIKLCCSSYKT